MQPTLADLTTPRTPEQWRVQLIQALQGVGFVSHHGSGSGSVTASGIATATASVVVEVVDAGPVGVGTIRHSVDGGRSWAAPAPIPATLSLLGAVLAFARSFTAGDRYTVELSVPSLPATSWQPGSVPRTLLENDAMALADVDETVATVARAGFLSTAAGAWLDLLATESYDLTRRPAVAARGILRLFDAAGAGPFTISPGQLWAISGTGQRFNNLAGGVIPKGDELLLEFVAESPGAGWNASLGTITSLGTPLPGVTVETHGDPWRTQDGVDHETDEELRARCSARWPQMAIGATEAGYQSWAREASPSVRHAVALASPTVPGQVDVYLAGSAGPVGSEIVTAVSDYLQPRAPLTSTVSVQSAAAWELEIYGTIRVRAGHLAEAQAAVAEGLRVWASGVGIGGVAYTSDIARQINSAPFVVGWLAPFSMIEHQLGPTQCVQLIYPPTEPDDLIWEEV